MTDNIQHRGQPDRSRINLSQDHEIRYWTEKFGCTPEELSKAVASVGNSANDVEQALKSKASSH